MRFILIFLSLFVSLYAGEKPLEKVSLQLQWLDQFQFAGYYMAKEKGFFAQAGFDVDIKKFGYETDVVGDVISRKTTYGIGRSSLIWYYSKGREISLLSATFQISPLTMIALESSNINDIKDFMGKTVMTTEDVVETASIYAMIRSAKVDEKSIKYKKHTFDIEELIDKRVDLYAGYVSNEPFFLRKKGVPYKLFSPREKGFDFYDDILFTSQEEVRKNPQRVNSFKNASIKGWEYAFENIEETVEIIHKKYNPTNKTKDALMFEAIELKKLAYLDDVPFGTIKKDKIERILDIYRVMGLVDSNVDFQKLIFSTKESFLSKEEEAYLKQKREINVCIISSMLPLSGVEHGKFVGIGSDILNLTKESINTSYKYIYTDSWEESLQNIKDKKCDILPVTLSASNEKELKYTTPYHYEPLVVVTKRSQNYIIDIESILDKEFAIVARSPLIENLKNRYPNIKLNYVSSIEDGFNGVEEGKYYGFIDNLITTAYAFKNIQNGHLKIAGQFNDKVSVGFGIRSDDEILFNIFEKLSRNIKHSDIHKFCNEWTSINYIKSVKFEYLKEIIVLGLLIIFIIFYKQHVLKKKNIELEELKDKLLVLNQTLESKIADAVSEMQKKDTYLLHKSRLAQMGEMISMIAHQWKQPLNAISTLNIAMIMAIELEEYNLCDKKEREDFLNFLNDKLKKIGLYTQNLSLIVSDFSDFYRPNKYQEELTLNNPLMQAYWLLEENLSSDNIDLCLELTSENKIMLFKNEFVQVLLNIINNAKEQFIENNIDNAQILIKSYDRSEIAVMEISDNAGGIDDEIMDKIFDPYFSTKFDKNGTGLGLHMSKNIIEQHYKGRIYVQNIENGAKFTIEIGTHKDENEK
ncbi:ABC transporter substrate-binding protein [Sulfurimonas sp.]|uniref:ABC transporter substrate-binding protein n=1 Tax=Sulfurimonas sp. TaxID=2022749 RepID=UPI00286E02F8|nr:ABC transporter substrate-binding protein [Sulfurimonas sp.]